jgi:hypothetical protein
MQEVQFATRKEKATHLYQNGIVPRAGLEVVIPLLDCVNVVTHV